METKRFILRPYQNSDLEAIFYNWANDDEVTKYLTWPTHKSLEDTKQILNIWLEEEKKTVTHRFCIVPKGEDKPIGAIDIPCMHDNIPEIGYCLSRKYWNQGIMTEVCHAYIDYLFSIGYTEIIICADERNIASNRVIEKCGFTFTLKETKICSSFKPYEVTVNCYKITK
jgi:ribosomal-protein-alanine N-acetyltransferase